MVGYRSELGAAVQAKNNASKEMIQQAQLAIEHSEEARPLILRYVNKTPQAFTSLFLKSLNKLLLIVPCRHIPQILAM